MATIHRATLSPSKIDVIRSFVPKQSWSGALDPRGLEAVGAYRFDDPAGEVGLEVHLVASGEQLLQVPLTYRAAPLVGADEAWVATMEHSVLGTRWVYDGCLDPVFVAAATATILTGGHEAEEWVQTDEGEVRREPSVRVQGSGLVRVDAGGVSLHVVRVVGSPAPDAAATLTGTWDDHPPAVLMTLVPS